ncbi:hypothetical protein CQW23_23496 [Capsicum baccatum]|uniref:Uncharacterized protein n=1 Tax=Capsicum baccatum TaxID=33114 RepID=A0A2G2VS54_CAPBA|nr:hypothetical protein CQW23_23496 [Capsicum baccatum]
MEISNKMRFHGEKMADVTIIEKILTLFDAEKMNRHSTSKEKALKASTFIPSNSREKGRGRGKGDRGNGDGRRNFRANDNGKEEAWSERKPTVDHFRIFDCIAYAHIPDEKRKKLDDKRENVSFSVLVKHQKT